MELDINEAILRLFLALLLGSVIGLERELSHQVAGLRTHILVCLGSTVFTLVSISDMTLGMNLTNPNVSQAVADQIKFNFNRDPSRIAAQVVAGIGFIGGGAVLRHGTSIRGLTTAASLWMMASVGMLIGIGHYYLSIVATFFSFLVLFTIGALERNFFNKNQKAHNHLKITAKVQSDHLEPMHHWLETQFGKDLTETKTSQDSDGHHVNLTCMVNIARTGADVTRLSKQLSQMAGVHSSSCKLFREDTQG